MRKPVLWAISVPSIALAACLAGSASAQEAASDQAGEIIVTANKRAENLQDVPISVSAVGGEALERGRTTQIDELVTMVPNLQLTSTVGDNTPIFALRGVSLNDFSLNQSGPVATYYDEVYKGNFALLGIALFDQERVEVLRGPQGTLYGKNTTGGAVNLISRAPKLGQTEGYFNLGYGNFDRIDVNGAINTPIGANAALRVAGTFARADGWFDNVLPGKPDLASLREYGLRAALYFEPSDGVDITLRASTSYQNPRNYGIFAQPEAVNRPGLERREIAANETTRRRARTYSLALTANIDLSDTLSLTSISSWDKGTLNFVEDTDGQGIALLEIPYFARANQIAQDLRLSSDFDGPFNFIVGAYYNREKVFNASTFKIAQDVASGGDVDGDGDVDDADCAATTAGEACQFGNSFDQIKKSFAIYTDMSFELSDMVALKGGLRFTRDTGRQPNFIAQQIGPSGAVLGVTIPTPASPLSYGISDLSGKIGVDFQVTPDNLIYATYSRGFRAPSFNAQAFFDPSELNVAKAEEVDSFELGSKNQFADRAVTLNLAAFYYKYRNQQFINVDPTTAAQTLLNIPRSRIWGGEAELTARASDALTLRGSLGVLDTRIQRGTVSGVNVAGNDLTNAPALTASIGVDATFYEGDAGSFSGTIDLAYTASQFFDVVNTPRLEQDDYALLSGFIRWQSADARFNASVWGKNLTNAFYFTSRVDLLAGFGFDYNHVAAPRTYGVTLGTTF
ncbi:TonB-dependent receptor [Erythrobacter tepidarius]|uniref:TonB-dependent receptor n=1 Tax=Erythrobacter tepidarius TaxID=60454 RepID=UPI000A3CC2CF|nr:TonB-dependent receptor [Erythrobacter tepidarius]